MSCEIPHVRYNESGYKCFDLHRHINAYWLGQDTPKQVECLNEKKHKNRSPTFILHYKTWALVKE